MAELRRVVFDVLKPHAPPLVEFTDGVSETTGVDRATVRLIELDRDVQNVAVTVEGSDVDYDAIVDTVEELGATIHSVDEVVCGDLPSTAASTPSTSGELAGDRSD